MTTLVLPPGLRPETIALLEEVARRRIHQDLKHGGPEHDDNHFWGDLAKAGAAYAWHGSLIEAEREIAGGEDSHFAWLHRQIWPDSWNDGWSPKTAREDLIDAAALILAEIESMDRNPS